MTSDAVAVVRLLFVTVWSLFVSFEIPGTHTTPAEFALFSLLFVFVIRLVRRFIFEDDSSDPLEGGRGIGGKRK